jgi:hypothetical protein
MKGNISDSDIRVFEHEEFGYNTGIACMSWPSALGSTSSQIAACTYLDVTYTDGFFNRRVLCVCKAGCPRAPHGGSVMSNYHSARAVLLGGFVGLVEPSAGVDVDLFPTKRPRVGR